MVHKKHKNKRTRHATAPIPSGATSRPLPPSPTPCPPSILNKIAFHLHQQNAGSTLAKLMQLSKASYPIAAAHLYKDVYISSKGLRSLFSGLLTATQLKEQRAAEPKTEKEQEKPKSNWTEEDSERVHELMMKPRKKSTWEDMEEFFQIMDRVMPPTKKEEKKEDPQSEQEVVEGLLKLTLKDHPLSLEDTIVQPTYPNEVSHRRKIALFRTVTRFIIQDMLDQPWLPSRPKFLGTNYLEYLVKTHPRLFPAVQRLVFTFPLVNTILDTRTMEPRHLPKPPGEPDKEYKTFDRLSRALSRWILAPDEVCFICHPVHSAEHQCSYAAKTSQLGSVIASSLRLSSELGHIKGWATETTTWHRVSFEAPPPTTASTNRFFFVDCEMCHPPNKKRKQTGYLPRDQMRADQISEIVRDQELDGEDFFLHDTAYVFDCIERMEFINTARFGENHASAEKEKKVEAFIAGMCRSEWESERFSCWTPENQDAMRFEFAGDVEECSCCAGLNLGYDQPPRRKRPLAPEGSEYNPLKLKPLQVDPRTTMEGIFKSWFG